MGTKASVAGSNVKAGTTATLNSMDSEPASDGSSGRTSVAQRAAMLALPGPALMRQSLSSSAGSAKLVADSSSQAVITYFCIVCP